MMTVSATIGEELARISGCEVRPRVPLGPLTWYGVGGTAEFLTHPESPDQLARIVRCCAEADLRVQVLGKGANLLVCEGEIPGVSVRLDRMKTTHLDAERGCVVAGGGADLEQLITATVRGGLAGLEVLAGIPATVGGAIRMNAGGAFGAIGPTVDSVTLIESDGRTRLMTREELHFSYRKSNIGSGIVAVAQLQLTRVTDQPELRQRLKEVMAYKKNSQPMAAQSAGCAFKNPPMHISEKGAGQIIDEAGLKGTRIGGAEVSPLHANFIVLHPGGAALDVLAVMEHVRRTVADRFGIELEREIVVWASDGV